jgi:hypothetical protein
MTIKSEPKSETGAIAQLEEEEINVRNQETPDVPFATATLASSDAKPTAPFATATLASSVASPAPSAVVLVPTTSATTSTETYGAATTPSSTVPAGRARVPPPNAPLGGHWVSRKFTGPATWTTCAIVSICTCFFCFLPCGVWAFLCPCDKKRVYTCHGTAYDEHGRVVGSA